MGYINYEYIYNCASCRGICKKKLNFNTERKSKSMNEYCQNILNSMQDINKRIIVSYSLAQKTSN